MPGLALPNWAEYRNKEEYQMQILRAIARYLIFTLDEVGE
jgi:hypothetical protein